MILYELNDSESDPEYLMSYPHNYNVYAYSNNDITLLLLVLQYMHIKIKMYTHIYSQLALATTQDRQIKHETS